MSQSYQSIDSKIASRIKLIVSDVDGTITDSDGSISPLIRELIEQLARQGIGFGLASGRTLPRLEMVAQNLEVTGPLIAENGGVAKLKIKDGLLDLGYSRQPALKAFETLKRLYPEAIEERQDNKDRLTEVSIWAHGLEIAELRRHLEDVELFDSGYMLHLTQKGVSKGNTLRRILEKIDEKLTPEDVLVLGDSPTDVSLFRLFPNSVFIPNPRVQPEERSMLESLASYYTDLASGEGFIQVISYILKVRSLKT